MPSRVECKGTLVCSRMHASQPFGVHHELVPWDLASGEHLPVITSRVTSNLMNVIKAASSRGTRSTTRKNGAGLKHVNCRLSFAALASARGKVTSEIKAGGGGGGGRERDCNANAKVTLDVCRINMGLLSLSEKYAVMSDP